jgi:hypothetical protein
MLSDIEYTNDKLSVIGIYHFIKYMQNFKGMKLLLCDRQSSHITKRFLALVKKNDICVI